MKKQPLWQYEQIFAEIIRQINIGDLKIGQKLPSEKELCDIFDVSRITVRKALAELEERNYIEKHQGQGSFVKDRFDPNQEISLVDSPGTHLQEKGHYVYIELHEFSILADGQEPSVREMMGLDLSDYLYKIVQIYICDRRPIIKRTTFISFDAFPMITAKAIQGIELIPYLARHYGLSPAMLHHSLTNQVDFISSELKNLLTVTPRKSMIKATTTYLDENNKVIYISTAVTPAKSGVFLVKSEEDKNMSEPHILLTRIDNRLVHGQVGVTWTKSLSANLILVANDQAASDPLQQKLMKSTADSSGVQIRFFTLQKTIDVIHKAADRQKIFIVVKTPEDALKLVNGNVPIKKINVGNMHFAPGKEEVTKKVYVDQTDKDALMELVNKGIDVYIQDVPGDHKTPVNF
ncbi:PTS galactosamine transporter subunit IIB [Lactobacillus kefiranofaciens subsp. kefirgranum]|uniref:PTS galactosamine transporter subunit IIB n=1 Tax=Lactobacillus kefiranofaciens TaxID=267818 RepID=UPI00202E5054|nr:PTS galactosamine transporter subunit IIB [Lactobacillus kefiranofaciens]URW70705.1 PTS galactosamine transporter subunit IIB [Lactobacillus kefiranofaciens subsp. kefirgranum]URW72649.1 PTS galactosamine transporter subunit IIB [Lactobacillus kefiranofaciens subsp. kefirgranum]